MALPRWVADEMLGRLARYLRFVGCDTVYGRDLSDNELIALAQREGRVLLTRDRPLSLRTGLAFLIETPILEEQWRAVRAAWPEVPTTPSFSRCTLCNGVLVTRARAPGEVGDPRLPPAVRSGEAPLYACENCGHLYWDGSHTAKVRERLSAWG